MSKRSRIVGFGSAGLLIIAGIACAFAFSGSLGQNLAFALVALGLVEGTALVFYEVGLTEDHEREREQERALRDAERAARESERASRGSERASRGSAPSGEPTGSGEGEPPARRGARESDHPGRLARPRGALDRMRGRPRRLR